MKVAGEPQQRMGLGLRRPLSACSSQEPMCCTGWRQQGDECGIGEWGILGTRAVGGGLDARQLGPLSSAAVCEGNSTCSENEVCVRPGECRCRHGYFGANCDTSERGSLWALGSGEGAYRGGRGLNGGGACE